MAENPPLTCPSAAVAPGVLLLGVRGTDGSVRYLRDRTPVDAAFAARVLAAGDPAQRFRFAAPCRERACAQWADGGCSLPALLTGPGPSDETTTATTSTSTLPRCVLRASCRWFAQVGGAACAVCPSVSTRAPASSDSTSDPSIPTVAGGNHE